MVPIGKLAFMKGKLIHTNEVLACLGDGYFAKYSASQAIELCNRRISIADDTLKRLEAERNLYEMKQTLVMEDFFGDQDKKDIFEHVDEEKLDEWRIQHREREKEYHKKLAEIKEKKKNDKSIEEDLFRRLDELELEEELEDEKYRLETERQNFHSDDLEEDEVYDEEDDDTSDSDEITMEMLQEELKKLNDSCRNKAMNDTSNISNSCDAAQDETFDTNSTKSEQSNHTPSSVQKESKNSCSTESENTSEDTNIKQKKRVSFVEPCDQSNADEETSGNDESLISEVSHFVEQDNTCNDENDEDIKIEFSPSSYIPHVPESNNAEIQSPIDIYKMFGEPIKPILKRSPNDMLPNQVVPPPHEDSSTDTEDERCNVQTSAYTSVVKDILEKKAVTSLNNTVEKKNGKRMVSRFKMERVGSAK
ncbi:unconventional prefoldin RPB5 interactor-like protein isoform X2 [Odontomachus brunneus]|nr:unconventional prefoldin RPB5 interactor-like protein isoform X2 [Odontomachus brunneus]